MAKGNPVDISATFQFIAKYPVQMLIAGGILLLLTGQILKTMNASDVGSQTATWGWILIVVGIAVFFGYLYMRKKK